MKRETKILLTRELLVVTGFFSFWFISVLLFIALVKNFSRRFIFDLSFYFILLYLFYLVDRLIIWAIERFAIKDKQHRKKPIDSVSVIFIIASIAGYFLIVLWYNFILPRYTG